MTDTKPQPLTDGDIGAFNGLLDEAIGSYSQGIGDRDDVEKLKSMFATERAGRLAAEAERDRLREALRPLAVLKVPYKPQGNAGAYSIRFSDIERAHAALAGQEGGNG